MKKPKKRSKADTFDVWGKPPASLTKALTPRQITALKAYVDGAMDRCYRLAFDCGFDHGLTEVADTANRLLDMKRRKRPPSSEAIHGF